MSQIFLVIQSLNPFEKFCLWALMIAINVSVAICQFVNFVHLEKCLVGQCSNATSIKCWPYRNDIKGLEFNSLIGTIVTVDKHHKTKKGRSQSE